MKKETIIAANRFGLGARPGELDTIDRDPKAWLLDQLQGPGQPSVQQQTMPSTASILQEVKHAREQRNKTKKSNAKTGAAEKVVNIGAVTRKHFRDQVLSSFKTASNTPNSFHQRLVHFWSNHFAVSADKQPVTALAGAFENEAIEPHLGGKFSDMLMAVEKHPAMILYLDNQRSIGPKSTIAKRAGRRNKDQQYGLNENLAREILELHTLGVDGGYGQTDVTSLARVLTGWSLGGGRGNLAAGTEGMFEFRSPAHEPGKQTIIGTSYPQAGVAQGEAVLRDLAVHPSTAQHVATKLARHFVADEPPEALVKKLSAVFLKTGGDLPAVHRALVEAEEPWQLPAGKYKSPKDFVISTYRALDREPDNASGLFLALEQMGQPPFTPGSPAGWPDTAAQWGGADALYKRIEWANVMARTNRSRTAPLALAESLLGPLLGDHSRTAISRAESKLQGTILLLASPEFQRR